MTDIGEKLKGNGLQQFPPSVKYLSGPECVGDSCEKLINKKKFEGCYERLLMKESERLTVPIM